MARALGRATADAADVINQQLAVVGVRGRQLEDAVIEARQEIAELERAVVSADSIEDGRRHFHRVFPHLKP